MRKLALLKTFLILLLAGLLAPIAHAADPSSWCNLVLTHEQYTAFKALVENHVQKRVEPIKQGRDTFTSESGAPVNVPEGIKRELAQPILEVSKKQISERMAEITTKWIAAFKESTKARYDEYKKNKFVVQWDADGLPITPFVQQHRDIALEVAKEIRGQGIKKGAPEFENLVAKVVANQIKKAAADKMKDATSDEIERQVDALAASLNKQSPDWNSVGRVAEPLVAEMVATLGKELPIDSANGKESAKAIATAQAALPEGAKVVRNDKGENEIVIPELKIRAYYDHELGTVVLEPSKGMIVNENGMLMTLDHGDGTTRSNASSWKHILGKLIDGGLNPVAINLPMAGIGPEISGLYPTIEYFDRRFAIMRSRADASGHADLPLFHVGRSMGAQKGLMHAILREGPDNPVMFYVEYSISNPYYIEPQIQEVYAQVEAGTVKGVVRESLDNATAISIEMRNELTKMRALEDPLEAMLKGDNVFAVQAEGDRDGKIGGKTYDENGKSIVIDKLEEFRDQDAQAMKIFKITDRLARKGLPNLEKISDDKLEAQHNPLSNYGNMEPEEGLLFMLTLATKDAKGAPLSSGSKEAARYSSTGYGLLMAYLDHLATRGSALPELNKTSAIAKTVRDDLMKEKGESKGMTYLNWYLKHSGASRVAVADAVRAAKDSFNTLDAATALKQFLNIDKTDLPAKKDETTMVIALNYGAEDYMAENNSPKEHMKVAREKMRAYRKKVTGSEDRRLLDWFREQVGVSKEEYDAAQPGYTSLAARLKKVEEFINEQQRIMEPRYAKYRAAKGI